MYIYIYLRNLRIVSICFINATQIRFIRKDPISSLHTIVIIPQNSSIPTHRVVDKPQKLQVNTLQDGCEYTAYCR